MKKALYIFIFTFFVLVSAKAEEMVTDSLEVSQEVEEPQSIYCWTYSDAIGTEQVGGIDTSMNDFYVNNKAFRETIALQYLGNLGSPAKSAIFLDRVNRTDFLFFQPYQLYYKPINEILFFNTKLPFTYINYYSGGTTNRDNRRLDGLFTVNVNSKLNFGMYGDWTKAYGAYPSLSTKNYNSGFWGTFKGRNNEVAAAISFNGYENYESGGFTEDDYITDPKNTGNLEPNVIPFFFERDCLSKLRNWNAFLNYKFHIGFDKEIQVNDDSLAYEFVPVTSIVYTFKSEVDKRRYIENQASQDSFYHVYGLSDSLLYNYKKTMDSTHYFQMNHSIGVVLNEEYNTLMKFGFAAYLTARINKYSYLDKDLSLNAGKVSDKDSTAGYKINQRYNSIFRNRVGVGAKLFKNNGEAFTYSAFGEYYFINEKKNAASFNFGGNISSKSNWGKQRVEIEAKANYEHYCPDFFEEYYYSNHIEWNNDFKNKQALNIYGQLSFPSFAFYNGLGLTFRAGLNNLKNYVYWNEKAVPDQYEDNLQLLTLSVKQMGRIWKIHWNNELTYQQCSNERILPLPKLSWFSSAYFQFSHLLKILNIQVGVDFRWNSAYYAPNYFPATGQFFLQDSNSDTYSKYGNYVYMDAFVNFQLKRVRFYVEFNHLNKLWSNNYNYMILRGYAMDPSYLKLGVSATLAR
jgi:hypothetical protein